MLRTLSNYADHPNVGGVILMDLGCEKTNLARVEKYLLKRGKKLQQAGRQNRHSGRRRNLKLRLLSA
jgi:altronate dehydratase